MSKLIKEINEIIEKIGENTSKKIPGLIDESGEINQELLTSLTNFSAGVEKLENGKEKKIIIPVNENSFHWLVSLSEKKRLEDELLRERTKSFQLKKELDSLEADIKNQLKKWEGIGKQMGSKASKIKNELALIDYSKLSAKELDNYLTELWEIEKMKNLIEFLLSGATEEKISKKTITIGDDENIAIGDDEHEELNKISDQLELERELRNTKLYVKQVIAGVLAGKWTDPKKRIPMDRKELLNEEYSNYSKTIDEMNDLNEINTFKAKILQAIAKHRSEYYAINECLSLGKKAIENKDVKRAKEALQYLSDFRKLQLEKRENFDDYNILLKRAGEFYALNFELITFIEKQEKETVAQIEQLAK